MLALEKLGTNKTYVGSQILYVNECETNGGAIMFVLGLKMKKLLLVGTITLSMLCTESMMDDHTVEAKVKK